MLAAGRGCSSIRPNPAPIEACALAAGSGYIWPRVVSSRRSEESPGDPGGKVRKAWFGLEKMEFLLHGGCICMASIWQRFGAKVGGHGSRATHRSRRATHRPGRASSRKNGFSVGFPVMVDCFCRFCFQKYAPLVD